MKKLFRMHFYTLERSGIISCFYLLISKAQKELDLTKIIAKAEDIIPQDMPVIPVYFYNYRFVQSKSLKDVVLSNIGQIDFKYSELI